MISYNRENGDTHCPTVDDSKGTHPQGLEYARQNPMCCTSAEAEKGYEGNLLIHSKPKQNV